MNIPAASGKIRATTGSAVRERDQIAHRASQAREYRVRVLLVIERFCILRPRQ